jgi:hypothetical protein
MFAISKGAIGERIGSQRLNPPTDCIIELRTKEGQAAPERWAAVASCRSHVIPAPPGIQERKLRLLDSRLRGNDVDYLIPAFDAPATAMVNPCVLPQKDSSSSEVQVGPPRSSTYSTGIRKTIENKLRRLRRVFRLS